MQFLKTLFWVVLAVVAVIFGNRNWNPVQINLWSGLLVEVKLPILIYGAFLIGFLPTFAWYRASRWRLHRRIDSHERALADIRGLEPAPVAPASVPPLSPSEPPAQS